MARITKQQGEQYVETFYGINPRTFRVESVHRKVNGQLTKMNDDMVSVTHTPLKGRDTRSEVLIVYGLLDVFSVPTSLEDAAWVKQKLEELRAKAEKMKTEAESKKTD